MTRDPSAGNESTVDRDSSSLRGDEADSLDDYCAQLKLSRMTPREWLKKNPHLSASAEFRQQLWCHYSLTYPPPRIEGFTIQDVLSEGGMGLVYLALDNNLKRLVAIKELTKDLREHLEFQTRFRLEAQILAKLNHPNIVKVHQAIKDESREFIAMEYVLDGSLVERMNSPMEAKHAQKRIGAAVGLIAKLARAIDYAHSEQIVHRDLKPGNILFDKNEEPKISDFGLAKDLLDPTDCTRGAVLGTARYMAPEQTEGKPAAPASDIWALGVILYQLLTGRLPFEGKNQGDLFVNIRSAAPAEMDDAIPASLRAICLKCLEKNPDDRFDRAADLAEALDSNAPPTLNPLARFGSRRLWRWAAASVAAVLLAAVSLAMLLKEPASAVVMNGRHTGYCSSIAFTADGQRAISENGGGEISIWDLKHRLKEKSLPHGLERTDLSTDLGGIIAVSPDGRYFVAAAVIAVPSSRHVQATLKRLDALRK